jgi:Sec-independent protein secretion pathway component TatC
MGKPQGDRMPLLDHIREFRDRLIKSVIGILAASIVGWIFYQEIIRLLTLHFKWSSFGSTDLDLSVVVLHNSGAA